MFGSADRHLRLIRDTFGVQVVSRDDELRLSGENEQVGKAARVLDQMQRKLRRQDWLTVEDVGRAIGDAVEMDRKRSGSGPAGGSGGEMDVFAKGHAVRAKTDGQSRYIAAIQENDLTICTGPAGTGKTYLAVAAAANMLKRGSAKRLVLARPAVEAGERLGFLPGDLQAKVNPYLRPLFDALNDMMDFEQVKRFMVNDVIEVIPLAFMRGRTLNDSVIILDEAQNTTVSQMLMFLTRLGHESKMIVTGDPSQIDLPEDTPSGLIDALEKLQGIKGIATVTLDRADIVRHRLVQNIVEAYERKAPEHHAPSRANGNPDAASGRRSDLRNAEPGLLKAEPVKAEPARPKARVGSRARDRSVDVRPFGICLCRRLPGFTVITMFGNSKSSARRTAIRENRPDSSAAWWSELKASGAVTTMGIAAIFCILAFFILSLRQEVLPYRPGQAVPYDVISRVDFSYQDEGLLAEKQLEAREQAPRVYKANVDKSAGDSWQALQDELLTLPDKVAGLTLNELPPKLKDLLDNGTLTALQQYQTKSLRARYDENVSAFIKSLRDANLVLIPAADRMPEVQNRRAILLNPGNNLLKETESTTYPIPANDDLKAKITRLVTENFRLELQPKILALTLESLQPTYTLDADATSAARNNAADSVPAKEWELHFSKNDPVVHKGIIKLRDWNLLRTENQAFVATIKGAAWKSRLGVAGVTILLTIALAVYTVHFQWRIVKNHARALAIAALLLSMLLLAELAGMGSGPIYLFAVAPTLLVGIILSIAYDQRYAVGVASIHGLLVTVGLDQRIGFLLIIWIGTIAACFMLGEIRSRSRLVEVGGVAAVAMMAATAAWGAIALDPLPYIANNCLYAGAAGLSVGFVVLGILPFIEKSFRITTGMTLLELADASHPLLRRLAMEAPGTYNHSLQVATLAEAAAEAIGANSLLCRVAAYYHDVGKINKSDYFVENQQAGQENRHINLNPSVSFLIIKGHVMDGVELSREYNLPTSVAPFIQQHHGTTLVEYFYHAACLQKDGDEPQISDTQFRYPGPKPKTKEVGIMMLADCAESATRSMTDPTASRIEALVHDLTMKRLLDGQFDDCDLTMRDLDKIEKSLVKTLLAIYHGRIAYPSSGATPLPAAATARTA